MTTADPVTEKLERLALNFHPLEAMFEVTARCNAACPYCYLRHETFAEELDTKDILRAIDRLDDAGVMFLGISGGEPFARPDMPEILRHITTKSFFQTTVITNGTLMRDEHVGFIVDRKRFFSLIRFSVFSHSKEVHDAYVGVPGALETVMNNAKKLKAGGVGVLILVNVIEENKDTFQDTRQYFEKMGFFVRIGLLKDVPTPHLKEMLKPVTSEDFFVHAFSLMDPIERKAHLDHIHATVVKEGVATGLCAGMTTGITVECTGAIIVCPGFRDKKVGNIFEDKPLADILGSSEELAILKSIDKTMIDGCRECEHINACVICLGSSYSEYGTLFHKPEQFCNFMKALIKSEKRS
jgi:radical SAM protein with 4Fe4S-binding SPASM domain